MELETLLLATIQTSFLLGLLHGINPCGHSWLVLAPFVSTERRGTQVALITASFLGGTIIACLLLGFAIGLISQLAPPAAGPFIEIITSIILIALGLILLYDPHILHHHTHSCEEDHHHDHPHHHEKKQSLSGRIKSLTTNRKLLAPALFIIGFVNMIVPCPTAAIMYSYALNSGNTWEGMAVFGAYAVSTAIAVSLVIALIFAVTSMAGKLQKKWIEPTIMRLAGVVIIIFSGYGIWHSLIS